MSDSKIILWTQDNYKVSNNAAIDITANLTIDFNKDQVHGTYRPEDKNYYADMLGVQEIWSVIACNRTTGNVVTTLTLYDAMYHPIETITNTRVISGTNAFTVNKVQLSAASPSSMKVARYYTCSVVINKAADDCTIFASIGKSYESADAIIADITSITTAVNDVKSAIETQSGKLNPSHCFTITASDTVTFSQGCTVFVGTGGIVYVDGLTSGTNVPYTVPDGGCVGNGLLIKRVYATGLTAALLVGQY